MLTPSLVEAHWLDQPEPLDDQCTHGAVLLSIDGHRLVAPQGGERTVSSAALNLLRTLVHDHTLESPVTEGGPLFPCCGFNVWVAGERFRVLISGCPAREGLTRALPTHGDIQETPKRHQTDDGELTCVKTLFRLHTLSQSFWTLETLMSCAMPFRRLFFVIGLGFFAFVGKAQSEEEIYLSIPCSTTRCLPVPPSPPCVSMPLAWCWPKATSNPRCRTSPRHRSMSTTAEPASSS